MRKKHILSFFVLIVLLVVSILLLMKFNSNPEIIETPELGFVASAEKEIVLYDLEYAEALKFKSFA